jgi:N-acetylglutamate synthase-like GNAT family acetyltransferase
VGFARVVTDNATFAYLADVFIIPDLQGNGLCKLLVKTIVEHPELQGLRRFLLATSDAHGLYAQYGFKPIDNPALLMQINPANVYEGNTKEV